LPTPVSDARLFRYPARQAQPDAASAEVTEDFRVVRAEE